MACSYAYTDTTPSHDTYTSHTSHSKNHTKTHTYSIQMDPHTPTTTPFTASTISAPDNNYLRIAFITRVLNQIGITTSRESRIAVITILFKYLEINNDLLTKYSTLRETVIDKAYQFKLESQDPILNDTIDCLLIRFGRPLSKPLPVAKPEATSKPEVKPEVTSVGYLLQAAMFQQEAEAEPEAEAEAEAVSPPMDIITVPANRLIYLALMEKAKSYTPDKHYQIKAYINAAHVVAKYPRSIYQESREAGFHDYKGNYYWKAAGIVPGIGPAIEAFISDVLCKCAVTLQSLN